MKSGNQKAWADIDEDEDNVETNFAASSTSRQDDQSGGKYVISRIQRPVEKTGADGTKERIDQTFLVKKWVFPVRRQVLERKKMAKFGEVKGIPKGEHRPGDYQLDAPIKIDKAEQEGEIGIVTQIENLSTAKVLQNIGKREITLPEKVVDQKLDKWASAFGSAAARSNYAIRVTNIISYESRIEDIDDDLQQFFRAVLEKAGMRLGKLRLLKTKDNPPRFINKCILTFDTQELAAKALSTIDGATYNDAELEASWAEPSAPRRF